MPGSQAEPSPTATPKCHTSKTQERARRKRHRRSQSVDPAEPKPAGWRAYLTLILLAVGCYLPMLQSGLIWSDYDQVERTAFSSMDQLADAWSLESIRREDPLTLSSYFLEQHLPLPVGAVHHTINLFLHIAAACLFLKILDALKLPAAFSASLVFALHPAVMQTLFWSGYREELVGLLFILAALYFGIQNRSTRDYSILLFLTALACLLHPAALVLPLLLTLVVFHQKRFPHLRDFNHLLPLFCIALFIGVWTHSGSTPTDAAPGVSVAHSSQNFFFFIKQALIPSNLRLFHQPRVSAEFTAGAQYTFLPIFLLIPFYALVLFNHGKPWARSVFVGLTAYLLLSIYGLLKVGTFLDGQPAHEDHSHYVALPIIVALAVCSLGGIIGRTGSGGKVLWSVGFTLFILMLSGIAVAHSLTLADRTSMWQKMSKQWPEAWVPKVALIETLQANETAGELLTQIEMINIMESIIELNPEQKSMRIALARAYRSDGQNAQALRHYRWIARQERPEQALLKEAAEYYRNLGMTWDAQTTLDRIDSLYNTDP